MLGLWLGDLARGAQQQAAQREKRQGEQSGENDLLHGGNYTIEWVRCMLNGPWTEHFSSARVESA